MHKGHSISVVIPACNEEGGVGHVIENVPSYVDQIIVVDNASTDRTAEIARSKGATAVFEGRRGYGSALRRGFEAATNDIIVTMDADGTYPAAQIAGAIDVLEGENLDFISCARFPLANKDAMSGRNMFGNQVLTVLFGLIYGKWLKDSQSGMWVFRRRILPLMHFEGASWEFSSEIKIEACTNPHIKFKEIHIRYEPRIGHSHFHSWRAAIAVGIHDIKFLVAQRFVRRRTRQRRAYEQVRAASKTGALENAPRAAT